MSMETTVYVLKKEEWEKLQRILNSFEILHFGVTDKGKVIVEYIKYGECKTQMINP